MRRRASIPTAFGAALRRRREVRGPDGKRLSQRAVGDAIGMSHSKISGVENGRRALTYQEVVQLARFLGEDSDKWLRLAGYLDAAGYPTARHDLSERDALLGQARDVLSRGPWSPHVADMLYAMLVELADERADHWRARIKEAIQAAKNERVAIVGDIPAGSGLSQDAREDILLDSVLSFLFPEE